MDLYKLTAIQAIEKIRKKGISVKELVDSFIERIDTLENSVHAWAYFNKGLAYSQVKEIEKRIDSGAFDGYFYGVPIGVKDIFNTKDMPTTMGSPIWSGFTPGNDARVVHNIRMEGGIIMGKTVTSEFAVHYLGPTINPYNSEHTPGTSSSGSAVAVATGMVPLALGTQTAGSIIKPASYCGIYGFKPSFGLLPRTGVLKTVDPLDHVGFFARSVDDMRLMLDAIRVKGVNYPYVCEYLEDKERQNKKKGETWRVAFVKTYVWSDAESYAKDNILKFIKRVAAVDNVELEEVELPERFNSAHDIHGAIYDKALSYYFKEEYKKSPEAISDIFKEMVERGSEITPDEYSKKLEEQNELTLMLDNFFKDYDVIFATSTAGEAPKREFYMDEKRDTSLIWTMCRVPSINLPLFKGPHGLPFGVQAVSRRYNDYLLLSFLKFLEEKGILTQSEIIFEEKRNKNGLYVRAQS